MAANAWGDTVLHATAARHHPICLGPLPSLHQRGDLRLQVPVREHNAFRRTCATALHGQLPCHGDENVDEKLAMGYFFYTICLHSADVLVLHKGRAVDAGPHRVLIAAAWAQTNEGGQLYIP